MLSRKNNVVFKNSCSVVCRGLSYNNFLYILLLHIITTGYKSFNLNASLLAQQTQDIDPMLGQRRRRWPNNESMSRACWELTLFSTPNELC